MSARKKLRTVDRDVERKKKRNREKGYACGHKVVDGRKECGFCELHPQWDGEFPQAVNTRVRPHPTEEDAWYCSKTHMWFGVNSEDNKLCTSCLWGEEPNQPPEKNLNWDHALERATLSRKELYEKYGFKKPLPWKCNRKCCQHVYTCTLYEFVTRPCPRCNNKRSSFEMAFIEMVGWEVNGWKVTEQEQHKLPWCRFYTDFTLRKGDKVVIVELDGSQHFADVDIGTYVLNCCSEKDREREAYHLKRGEYVLRIAYNYPLKLLKETLVSTLKQVEANKLGASIIYASLSDKDVYDVPVADLMKAVPGLTAHSHIFDVLV